MSSKNDQKLPPFIKQLKEFVRVAKENDKPYVIGAFQADGVYYSEEEIEKLITD